MKNVLLALVMGLSVSAFADGGSGNIGTDGVASVPGTTLISADKYTNSKKEEKVSISTGFRNDGFDSMPAAMCYVGKIQGVCTTFKTAEKASYQEYEEGGHGYFYVDSCEVKAGVVSLKYGKKTDYDGSEDLPASGVKGELKIKDCSNSDIDEVQ